jgi:hypothetical protein
MSPKPNVIGSFLLLLLLLGMQKLFGHAKMVANYYGYEGMN